MTVYSNHSIVLVLVWSSCSFKEDGEKLLYRFETSKV